MKVVIGAELRPTVVESGELTSLSVERAEGVTETDVDAALRGAGAGTAAEGYAWLSVAWLRGEGPSDDPQWTEAFGKMIAYAASKGWTDSQQDSVRAHLS
ncbi:hypothetical protein QRX50_34360 [Amycolatopsis carbonis]|uniref:Uncharacterized protein n=1 Tax=Amycolatopsis carbonis TaxID=715471 RepID=A0A9Y2IAJ2_9PSEU|nr:hypothetical protein [Amycolatopsis sp. 2-15]WIX76522.1 hypothetical protein QRX50_34360 [Amycolatopsis sp. 2-15]